MKPAVALTVHAEALQRDDVWNRVLPVVRSLQRSHLSTTFFVYPFPAAVEGIDIAGRVSFLASSGQEIGQHTHFYRGDKISRSEKTNDLSDGNVRHCISRDLATLRSMGAEPRGFLAGAWHVTPAVLDTLVGERFAYDCSARLPVAGEGAGGSELEWIEHPISGPGIVRLPTTCSLGQWFRWGRRTVSSDPIPFQIVYLHDYELLRLRTRLMLKVFLRMNRRRLVPAGELVERLTTERAS